MKKALFLTAELLGYILTALVIGSELDSYFSLKGKGTLSLMALGYILWFFHFYKVYLRQEE